MHNPDTPVALDSAGELHLQTVTTTEQTSSTGQASNLAWQRMQNQGRIDETTHYNQLGNNVTSVNTISRSEPRSDSDGSISDGSTSLPPHIHSTSRRPIPGIRASAHVVRKTRMRPLDRRLGPPMLDGVVMDVIHVPCQIGVIANLVLPKAPLPDAALAGLLAHR